MNCNRDAPRKKQVELKRVQQLRGAANLKYHAKTFELLETVPIRSPKAVAILREREKSMGFAIPESIREWYELINAEGFISQQQIPYSLAELGLPAELDRGWAPEEYHLGDGRYDLVRAGYLPVVKENQFCVLWHARLDGNPDPAVFVHDLNQPGKFSLKPYAESFSDFIFTLVWDYQFPIHIEFSSETLPAGDILHRRLSSAYPAVAATKNWQARTIRRYGSREQRAVLFESERALDLSLSADSWKNLAMIVRTAFPGDRSAMRAAKSACLRATARRRP